MVVVVVVTVVDDWVVAGADVPLGVCGSSSSGGSTGTTKSDPPGSVAMLGGLVVVVVVVVADETVPLTSVLSVAVVCVVGVVLSCVGFVVESTVTSTDSFSFSLRNATNRRPSDRPVASGAETVKIIRSSVSETGVFNCISERSRNACT